MPEKLSAKDISVVVQGKIEEKYIHRCLSSIRKYLTGAEIVLSIWKDDLPMVNDLDFDQLVVSDDPGAFPLNKENKQLNNVNRQIVGTQQGIKAATRKYILKFRSNMCLKGDNILRFYQRHCSKADHFKQRMLALNYYTRNPRVVPMPYHLSDWVLFGLAEDVCNYYGNVTLQSIEDGLWYKKHENHAPLFLYVYARFAPEQHIFMSWLKTIKDININEYFDTNDDNIILTEELLSKDFIIMNLSDSGMDFLKYPPNRYYEETTLLSMEDWLVLKDYYTSDREDSAYSWFVYCLKCRMRHFIYFYLRGGIRWMVRSLRLRQVVKAIIEK